MEKAVGAWLNHWSHYHYACAIISTPESLLQFERRDLTKQKSETFT
jgi:hypothetical protein